MVVGIPKCQANSFAFGVPLHLASTHVSTTRDNPCMARRFNTPGLISLVCPLFVHVDPCQSLK